MLQKNIVQITLREGIDTKTDSKQLINKLTKLENASMSTLGALRKRNGLTTIAPGTAATKFCAEFNNELIVGDGKNLFSYDEKNNAFVNKGNLITNALTVSSIVSNGYSQSSYDFAEANGLQVHVYESTQGGVFYSVVEKATGRVITNNALISVTGVTPKLLASGNTILLFYFDTTLVMGNLPLIAYAYNTVTQSLGAGSTIVTTYGGYYDVCTDGTTNFVSYYDVSALPGIYTFTITTGLVTTTAVRTSTNLMTACSLSADANNLSLVYDDTLGNVKKILINKTTFAQIGLATVIDTYLLTGPLVTRIASVWKTATLHAFIEKRSDYYAANNIDNQNANVRYYNGTSVSVFKRSVGLASKPIVESTTGLIFILTTHESSQQSQYFLITENGDVVSKLSAPGNGAGLLLKYSLPTMVQVSSVIEVPYSEKVVIGTSAGNIFSLTGISLANITFSSVFKTSVIGNQLHIPGGSVSSYDGQTVNEQGFHLYPEGVNTEATTNVAINQLSDLVNVYGWDIRQGVDGSLELGSKYSYKIVYEWEDSQGQKHRSAPSTAVQMTTLTNGTKFATYQPIGVAYGIYSPAFTPIVNSFYGAENPYTTQLVSNLFGSYVNGGTTGGAQNQVLDVFKASGVKYTLSGNNGATDHLGAYQHYVNFPSAICGVTDGSTKVAISYVVAPTDKLYFNALNANGAYLQVDKDLAKYITANSLITDEILKGTGGIGDRGPYSVTSVVGDKVYCSGLGTGTFIGKYSIYVNLSFNFTNGSNAFTFQASNQSNVYVGMLIYNGTSTYRVATVTAGAGTISTPAGVATTYAEATGAPLCRITIPPDWLLKVGTKLTSSNVISWNVYNPGAITGGATQVFTGSATITKIDSDTSLRNYKIFTLDTVMTGANQELTTWFLAINFASNYLSIPTLRVTAKSNVNILVYRTTANGTAYYRCSNITYPVLNDTTLDYIYFQDRLSDYSLTGNELLYTESGELINNSLPAVDVLTTYRNRLIAIPSENKQSWYYSKQVLQNTPVETSSYFVQNVDSIGGDITSIETMDDKLIIFKKNSIFFVVGDGPTPSGTQNDFSQGMLISTDCGCVDAKSVVRTPLGIIFKSAKGIYLLERNLSLLYIGKDVESYNALTILSGVLMATLNQVRFVTNGSVMLVYDYLVNQWYVFNLTASDACTFKNAMILIGSSIRKENTTFLDDATPVTLKFATSWISPGQLQGFTRIYKLLILGDKVGSHRLKVNVFYDYSTTPTVLTIDASTFTGTNYEWRVFLPQQKCTAVMFEIFDETLDTSEGVRISGLALEVGVKRGLYKLPAAQGIG